MFKNPSFLVDIICTVVWGSRMVRYARKGFLASMVGLVGTQQAEKINHQNHHGRKEALARTEHHQENT